MLCARGFDDKGNGSDIPVLYGRGFNNGNANDNGAPAYGRAARQIETMKKRSATTEARQKAVAQMLGSVPQRNTAVVFERKKGGLLASVPIRRPRWLVPPISWVIPWSPYRRVQLDEVGSEVLDLCDGARTVEEVIEKFAEDHKLSFREGQVAVTAFLRELLSRGIVAIVGFGPDVSE